MSQIFPVCVAFLATLFLSATALPLHAEGTEPPPGAKNVAPNHTIIIPFGYDAIKAEQKNAAIMEHAPIIRAWEGVSYACPEPVLFFALWRDGTIIWSKSGDKNLDRSSNGTEHFQSKISEKLVEDFLSAFDKVDFLEFSGKIPPKAARVVGPGLRFFLLKTENVQFSFGMDSFFWRGSPVPPSRQEEVHQMAEKWQATKGLLLKLIPEKGEQISFSIKEEKDKRQWEITPIPLRQEDRQQDNGNVRNNGNWGQVPLRPR